MVFEGMNSTKTALGWIERFNKNSKHQGIHDFFESHLSFFLILVFIKNYIRNKINNLVDEEKDKKLK